MLYAMQAKQHTADKCGRKGNRNAFKAFCAMTTIRRNQRLKCLKPILRSVLAITKAIQMMHLHHQRVSVTTDRVQNTIADSLRV